MPGARHSYEARIVWTGNLGEGTSGYRAYARRNELSGPGRPVILGSSDPAFRGDADRWDPERLLVAALSQCHMLSYLHQCADAGVVVTACRRPAAGSRLVPGSGSECTTGAGAAAGRPVPLPAAPLSAEPLLAAPFAVAPL